MSLAPQVFTIPSGAPFLELLARGIVAAHGAAPEELAKVTVLLPTRRACRALADAFLRSQGGRPMVLPRMTPLGDIDEDELALSDDAGTGEDALAVPPAMSGLRRQLFLTRLIAARADIETTPDQAARLAKELARLLDQVETERLGFDGLAGLVPDEMSAHWRRTLDFLSILTEAWPAILAAEGAVDPARRRNLLLAAQAQRWRAEPPAGPVIAAGSTGSIPATADLLAVVAGLPRGRVVLPGLDREASDAVWEAIGPSHPQFGLKRLLAHLGLARAQIADWPAGHDAAPDPPTAARARLLNLALTPPQCTGAAAGIEVLAEATQGMIRIDAADPDAEARAIALIMRRTLETPDRTAALVTPDRSLARRVGEALRRWGLTIDDSAGRPLARTPAGAFLLLAAEMAAEDMAPVPLLGLLKHPLAGGGQAPGAFRAWVRSLEKCLLRGPRPGAGMAGLRAAAAASLGEAERGRRHGLAAEIRALGPGLDVLEGAVKPLARLIADGAGSAADLLSAHIALAEALAADDCKSGAERLWAGDDGEAAAAFVAEMADACRILDPPFPGPLYPAFFAALMDGRAVRPAYPSHPRLHIWGNLEARLLGADVMILGGLNEETWPAAPDPGPWMSRPMAKDFGLAEAERRIGLSAHDFVQAAAAPNVVLSRAARVGGTPTVPSRWLQRLDNLLSQAERADALAADDDWLGWAAALDQPEGPPRPAGEPAPRPPLASRPRRLSVTRIKTLVRDPYAVYAERILQLRLLDPIDADPDARHKGIAIHDILDAFAKRFPGDMPDDAEEQLIAIGEKAFAPLMAWPAVRALWWPRFERIAGWFVGWERARRAAGIRTIACEVDGAHTYALAGGDFLLTAKADRIDLLADGSLCIVDYKTGTAPTNPQMESGIEPQLPLEGIIAEAGGFAGIEAGKTVSELLHVQVSGGREPGKASSGKFKKPMTEVLAATDDGIRRMLGRYDLLATPYRSRRAVQYERRSGDYDHLARLREWALAGGDDE